MTNKRTNTAVWIESRSHWRISVQKDGVRRDFYSSKPGKAGQREANSKADRWLEDDVFDDRIKVKQVYDLFLQQEHGRGSSANYEAVESIGRNWILPNIGNKRISSIKLGDYQAIIIKAEKAGKSRKTLSNIRGIISRFAKFCRQNGYSELYTTDLEVSKHAPMKIKKILQPEDLRTLFTSDETILNRKPAYDIYINAYRFQTVTGLRPGELIGLKWSDITPHEICVKRSINVRGETTRGKNDNAIRTIPITPLIQKILDDQKNINTTGYVFQIHSEHTYYNRWKRYCLYNGIPVMSLYELRHTFVSIAKVLPEGQLKTIVGHSKSMDTFGIYGHELNGEREKSAAILDDEFTRLLSLPISNDSDD